MQKMRGTVVTHGVLTTLADHFRLHTLTHTQVPLIDVSIMHDQPLQRTACILHMEDPYGTSNIALIADLTTTFSIEGGCIENDERLLRRTDTLNLFAIHYESNDLAIAGNTLIACELSSTHALKYLRESTIISRLCKNAC